MKKNKNIFPNRVETEAYYDQFTQYINLCRVTNQEFADLKKKRIVNERTNLIWSTYTHELTHWFDHTIESLALKDDKSFEEFYILYKTMENKLEQFVYACGI